METFVSLWDINIGKIESENIFKADSIFKIQRFQIGRAYYRYDRVWEYLYIVTIESDYVFKRN